MVYKSQKSDGFTLIEALIVMVILGLLGAGLLSLQYILAQNQTLVFTSYLAIDEANSVVSTFVKEIRGARTGDNGSYPIESALDNQIVFYSDYDYDGNTEKIRYTLNGTVFEKGVIEPQGQPASYPASTEKVKIISENVRNLSFPAFTYYNGDWPLDTINNPLTIPVNISDIKTVGIYLKLNTRNDDSTKGFELQSYSSIRMLKDNL